MWNTFAVGEICENTSKKHHKHNIQKADIALIQFLAVDV